MFYWSLILGFEGKATGKYLCVPARRVYKYPKTINTYECKYAENQNQINMRARTHDTSEAYPRTRANKIQSTYLIESHLGELDCHQTTPEVVRGGIRA